MVLTKRVVLDILKPHHPDALAFATALAECGPDYRVHLTVVEMDDKTQTLRVQVDGADIDMERLRQAIGEVGGSLHSIDEVLVRTIPDGD